MGLSSESKYRSEKLEILIDGKPKATYTLRIRKPIVKIHVEKNIPMEVGIGLTVNGSITIYDSGSEIDPGKLLVKFGDYRKEVYLHRMGSVGVEIPVKHGEYQLLVFSEDGNALYKSAVAVKGIPPEVDVKTISELHIKYGVLNTFEFAIESMNRVPFNIGHVSAILNNDYINDIKIEGNRVKISFNLEKYSLNNEISLDIEYTDLDGNRYELSRKYSLNLYVEPYGEVSEYLSRLSTFLKAKVFDLIESESLDVSDALEFLDELVNTCSDLDGKVSGIYNIEPCSLINKAFTSLLKYVGRLFRKSIEKADYESSSKLLDILNSICTQVEGLGDGFPYCDRLDIFRSIVESLPRIIEYYNVVKTEGIGVIDRYNACSMALKLCSEASSNGLEISLCRELMELSRSIESGYRGLIDRVGELYRLVIEGLRRFDLKKVFESIEELNSVCREIDYKADECRELDRINGRASRIREFMDSIVLRIPGSSGSRVFRGEIFVDNFLDRTLTDLYIDLGRAKYFFEVESEKIKFPPIYPGMSIDREVRFRAKYRGRLVLPYSICLGGYCIDKQASIEIGVWRRSEATTTHPVVFLGRGVEGLQRYELPIIRGNPLTRPIRLHTYECRSLLGVGGFSATMLCIDRMGYSVVVKIPLEAYHILLAGADPREVSVATYRDRGTLERFSREASILRELRHPNIVRLLEYHVEPVPMLVLEFCELGDLNRLLAKAGKLDPVTALEIIIPVTSALAKAHSHKPPIIHRDLKPGNILLTRDYVPKLTDFNIAKIMSTVSKTSHSKAYTEAYAAPEQVLKGHPELPPPGPYTDMWALGVILYEILTGRRPYEKIESLEEIEKPQPPSKYNKEVPPELDDLIQQMLEPHPHERPQDTNQLLNQLTQIYQEITHRG